MALNRSRRHFLATTGLFAGGGLAGCSGGSREPADALRSETAPRIRTSSHTPSTRVTESATGPPTTAAEDRFEETVNMETDAGCDPTGSEPCDRALEATVGDDLLLEFPPGKYRFEKEHRFSGLENFGIVGTGPDRRAVQFVFPSGYSGIVLGLWNGRDWLLENFTLQQSLDHQTGVGLVLVTYDGLEMRDVEIAGFSPFNRNGGQRGLYCDVLSRDGVADIERYVHRGPSQVGNYPQGTQAFLADEHHRGTIYCRDWHIENAGENGLYASRTAGDVRVEGGYFRNNDVASIRVCGEGSYVRDATVVIDTDEAHPANGGAFDNTRGIWWESGQLAKEGGVIENCDLVMRSTVESQGLLRIERTAGTVTIRNCRFLNQTPWRTVTAMEPTPEVQRGETAVHAKNLSIETRGSTAPAFEIVGRPRSVLKGVQVSHPPGDGDAVRLDGAPGTLVVGGTYRAGRFPIHLVPRNAGRSCSLRLTERVDLRSDRFAGQLLIPAETSDTWRDAAPVYCVSIDSDGPSKSLALTAMNGEGLYGHLLDQNGQIVSIDEASGGTPD